MSEWSPLTDDQLGLIYEAADRNAPPSVGWGILADHLGFLLMDQMGDYPEDLLDPKADLSGLAKSLAEEVLRLADEYALAPFDGTLAENLEDGDTEQNWLVREDLLPFVQNWRRNALALGLRETVS